MATGALTMANYNGFIAPLDPDMDYYQDEYSTGWNGYHYIFKIYGEYYMLVTGMTGGRQVRVDYTVTPNMLHVAACRNVYKLNKNGSWVSTSKFSTNVHLFPIDDVEVIYADQDLFYLELGDSGIWPSSYCEATPIAYAITDYPDLPTVTAYGWNLTGDLTDPPQTADCYVPKFDSEDMEKWKCNLRNLCYANVPDGGTVTVDWYRNGELYSTSSVPGATGIATAFQPPLDVRSDQTWCAVVSNTEGTLTRSMSLDPFTFKVVLWNFDTNTPDVEEGDENITIPDGIYEGITGGEPEEPNATAEELKQFFWKGFASSVGMYGGGISSGNDSGASSYSSGEITDEKRMVFWRGFASGAAMYSPVGSKNTGEPVVYDYNYNGVILPALPEWDKEEYPYVMISNNGYTDYEDYTHCTLIAHKTLPTTKNNFILGDIHGVPDSTDYVYSTCDPKHYPDGWYSSENGYGACSSSNGGSGLATVRLAHVIWANYDVVNTNGSVYLAATDPIPVYE